MPYVRCGERECQYVDRNEPPCPLRLESFRESVAADAVQLLVEHAGLAVCDHCLAQLVDAPVSEIRSILMGLAERPLVRVVVARDRCAHCREDRWTARASAREVALALSRGAAAIDPDAGASGR
jgi:hypothetical protein